MIVEPLTAAGRTVIVDAVRRRCEEAGLPWHGRVVWTPSPSPGTVAAARARRQRHRPAAGTRLVAD